MWRGMIVGNRRGKIKIAFQNAKRTGTGEKGRGGGGERER